MCKYLQYTGTNKVKKSFPLNAGWCRREKGTEKQGGPAATGADVQDANEIRTTSGNRSHTPRYSIHCRANCWHSRATLQVSSELLRTELVQRLLGVYTFGSVQAGSYAKCHNNRRADAPAPASIAPFQVPNSIYGARPCPRSAAVSIPVLLFSARLDRPPRKGRFTLTARPQVAGLCCTLQTQ